MLINMVLSYYVSGNTASGRVNLLTSNVKECDQVIVLRHPSPQVKTTCLQEWINEYVQGEERIEILESVEGKSFIDGCILRKRHIAIVSDTVVDESIKNTHTIDLSSYILETESLIKQVKEYQVRQEDMLQKAWESFATGLKIHDDLEHIYIQHMDFDQADEVAVKWKERYLPTSKKQEQQGSVVKRLFGTNTPEGSVNIVPNIIDSFSVVHHVKGRAGTGKSYFMNTVAEAYIRLGYDIERYICSFDPESTDMIIVPELDICLFDSTNPHEFTPKEGDVVIDLYKETVEPGIDETYKESIKATTSKYKSFMRKGNEYLKQASHIQQKIDDLYSPLFTSKVVRNIISSMEEMVKKET